MVAKKNICQKLEELLQQAQSSGLFKRNRLNLQSDFHSESGAPNIIEVKAHANETSFSIEVCRISNSAKTPVWSTKFELPLTRDLTQAEQYAANEAVGIIENSLDKKSLTKG